MNVFNKVTLQSLKKNKTRTVVTVIGIILSAAMICAVTTFASSFQNYTRETAIYEEGNWHGSETGAYYETYEKIKAADGVAEAVFLQQLGYAPAEGSNNEYKPYIYLLGAGPGVENVFPIHMVSGRYPTSPTEILLPRHMTAYGCTAYAIGDTVTLELGQRMLDGLPLTQQNPCYVYDENGGEVRNAETLVPRETRTYTVVGYYERLSFTIEEYSAPGYTALTVADSTPSDQYAYDVYFRMEKPRDVYAFMEKLRLGGQCNTDLLTASGTSRYSTFSAMLYSLAAIVIALIMFGSVALIYNAFSISVSERTKQFGLLSSVGATKKQLRRMVLFEAMAVSAIGIPLGVLAGVGGISVTLLLIGDKFRSMGFPIDMKPSVSPAAVIIAAAVALVTVLISAWIPSKRATRVSAVEAIRQSMDVTARGRDVKTSRLTYRLFGLPGMLAGRHYKRNRKKYRTTVLSLFMSIVLFVSASAFTDYLMESVSGGFATADYDLEFTASGDAFTEITPDELLSRVTAAKSVTGGAYMQERYFLATVNTAHLTEEGIGVLDGEPEQPNDAPTRDINFQCFFINDSAYRDMLKEYGLSEKKFMNPQQPVLIALDGFTQFSPEAQKYETTRFFRRDEFDLTFQTVMQLPEGGDSSGETAVNLPVNTTLRVGKVLTEMPRFIRIYNAIPLLCPLSMAGAVYGDYDAAGSEYVYRLFSKSHAAGAAAVESVLSENGFKPSVWDVAEQEESSRNIVTIIRVFSYGFIVLISLIAAANVFNTISTNISLRRREFAMLKSVGMTQKGFNRMMNYECLLYGFRALLYGLPVSCGVTYLIYLAVTNGFDAAFRLPLAAIGIATLSVFAVVFATMMYAMGKIKRDNPIDALKNENL